MAMTSRHMTTAGWGVAAILGLGLGLGTPEPAHAQEMSEKSIKSVMDYAWSLVPQQFTKPDGKTIVVDKKKKDEVVVPLDTAREVVRVGYLSAHAQICSLREAQADNFNSMMRREADKKKWSDQQMLYITQLHLTTVMLLTGKFKLVEKGDDGKEVVEEVGKGNSPTCSPDQGAKVTEKIAAYVNAGPAITRAVAPAAAPATTGSTTAPAPAAAAATATPAPVAVQPAAETKKTETKK
jgi:hypothetical protein